MARVAKGAKANAAEGLAHRFVRGLRFDGSWQYAVRMASGRQSWRELPLTLNPGARARMDDPDGAWWCVRRCVAVLRGAPWGSVRLPPGLSPRPDAQEAGRVLGSMLPGWMPLSPQDMCASLEGASHALGWGGCALVRLKLSAAHRSAVCWAWVVGVEVQERVRALLVVGPQWPPCWGCGYGARVMADPRGACHVRGTEGQHLLCDGMQVLILAPPLPP